MRALILLLFFFFLFACGEDTMPTPTMPSFTMDPLSVVEGNEQKSVFLSLRLTSTSESLVSVTLQTIDNTAIAGEDYVAISSQKIDFPPGNVQTSLQLEIIGDDEFEEDESFIVRASQISGATLARTEVEIVIENDDSGSIIPETGYSTPASYPGMELIWSDEFNGDQLDASYWSHELGRTDYFGNSGWGNNELQYYRAENTSFMEGNLVIQAKKELFGGAAYTSSRIITRDKFDFKYGRVDIRAVLPTGKGLWPALWMLGSNYTDVGWPACGEIDIVEILGQSNPGNQIKATVHWQDPNAGGPLNHAEFGDTYNLNSGNFDDEFHVYSLIWKENQIQALVDDQVYFTISTTSANLSEFRERFYLIFNVAVGGNAVGSPNASTIFPKYMIVDYVRVFQDN